MRALPSSLRSRLETSVLAARRAAEAASRAAIENLGTFADRRPEHLDAAQAALRIGLRAKWRQLGSDRDLLVAECAYEQWHRLLFARFLAENGLLLHPQFRAPVTLTECEDLAADLREPDAWSVAARFAAEILPGIFRLDDPCVRLRLAPEGRQALEQILDAIPSETFIADDALGWVYQFWQKNKKDEVNASERKIGGADLGPVTQLFTENYMVRFLLENSLGAWWAARYPDSPLVKGFEYLRFDNDGKPAACTFDGWPDRVAEVTVMDPCCGSGHFLVEAFSMLWQMRAEEEGLAPIEAQNGVLRDNLFGLELDPRCVQIATFAVALQAWKGGGGWRQLPVPNIACSGIAVKAPVDEWEALAKGDQRLENAIGRLHILFRDAETLGSLIDPRRAAELIDRTNSQRSFDSTSWDEVGPLVIRALQTEASDPAVAVLKADAVGIARAAAYLGRRYSLVVTNVPYLKRSRQDARIAAYCDTHHYDARHDLALAMLDRFSDCADVIASVAPHGWLFMSWNRPFRERWLQHLNWRVLAHLGPGAFRSISGEIVNVILGVWVSSPPAPGATTAMIDIDLVKGVEAKQRALKEAPLIRVAQLQQLRNADAKVTFEEVGDFPLLAELAGGFAGVQSGDYPRFGRFFWELPWPAEGWVFQQSTVQRTAPYSGREHIFFWEDGRGQFVEFVRERLGAGSEGAWIRGTDFAGQRGVAVSSMSSLPVTLYTGELFDNNTAVILPKHDDDLPAIWAFAQSPEFERAVRRIDTSIKVTNATFVKIPFDFEHWRRVAEDAGPLPEPWSDDPTQWLFKGRPETSTAPLHVAVGRLLGYRWPEQPGFDDLDTFADADGIVCLPAVAGESPAVDRMHWLLATAFGDSWSPAMLKELLQQAGSNKKNLADWLRDEFFKQHCSLLGNRPCVWHVWDGQRDGFSALVNYHRLDRKTLEKLTYTYLGQDWVERQRAEVRDGVAGADTRLAAAFGLQKRLEAILEGEAPLDIYVRWKKIHEQPIGWEPDLNDGVRLNIRPFVEAGVLRSPFNVHWRKDRGKNPDGTERLNDVHLTLAEKIEARKRAGRA
jgi:hypothetical protein